MTRLLFRADLAFRTGLAFRIRLGLCFLFLSQIAFAHSGSTAFMELARVPEGVRGEWLLALRDIDTAVGVDLDQDGRLTWGELQQRLPAATAYAQSALHAASSVGDCGVGLQDGAPVALDGSVYLRWPLTITCENGAHPTRLSYSALFDYDASHRAVVIWRAAEHAQQVLVLSPAQRSIAIDTTRASHFALFTQGVRHILEGWDHLLFLLALLVPLLLATDMLPGRLPGALLRVITAFTVGHSLTLGIAVLANWSPPMRWVEAAIAATVIAAGINIVRPLFRETAWTVAGLFGLVHGFGFAAVMREFSLAPTTLAQSLLLFNLGVEAGQLLIVAFVCPPLWLLARRRRWVPGLRAMAALGTLGAGTFWLLQRMLW